MSEHRRKALNAYKEAKRAAEQCFSETRDTGVRVYMRHAENAWGALAEAEERALKEAEGR
jgi:hypothetical protein